jgi:hypothetical protein
LPVRNVCRAWPVLALLAATLGGCSGDFSAFSFGKRADPPKVEPNLFPAKYKSEIADFMRTYLANPTKVKDAFIAEPALKPVAGVAHYVTCVRYNARNGANQYEGPKSNLAIFLEGRINQFLPGDVEMCAGLNYQRYPEIENMVP